MEIELAHLDQLPKVAQTLLAGAGNRKKWLFTGEIGAGKTTLIQELCKVIGIVDKVTSPTFSLINEYTIPHSEALTKKLYHIDLYRLNQLEEAIEIGIEDYLYDENYCFIEWPQLIEPLWPEEVVQINLEIIENSRRKVIFL